MNENVKTIIEILLSSQEYFKEIKYSDDIGQFATMIDDFNELPAIGVFFNDYTPYDWQGTPMVACDLTFFVSCDMLSPTTEVETMQEFLTNVNAFISLLSPYIQARPKELRHFKDTALRGVLISVNFLQNYSCTDAPTPPVPQGDFYDFLQAVNGSRGRNVFLYMGLGGYIDGQLDRLEIGGVINSNGLFVVRMAAGTYGATSTSAGVITSSFGTTSINLGRTDVEVFYDFADRTYGGVNADGETVSGECRLGYGTRDFYGSLQFFFNRLQDNSYTQRLKYFRHYRDGVLMRDWRPYMTGEGVVGLKDTITGEFLAPQYNDTITVVNENSRSLTLGTPENLDKSVISDDGTTDLLKKSDSEDGETTE